MEGVQVFLWQHSKSIYIAILLLYAEGTFPVQSTGSGPVEDVSNYIIGTGNMANAGIQPNSGMCLFACTVGCRKS